MGKKQFPHNYIDAAVAAGGDAVAADIRDLMKGRGDQGRMDYLNKIGVVFKVSLQRGI
jgi:hypothetical protein